MSRLLIVVTAASSLVMTGAGGAAASCAPPPPLRESLAEARVAFVGVVLSTSNLQRNAQVEVEKIWLGERLPDRVEVEGGEQSASVSSSVDREWEEGGRYLFVLEDASAPFRDEACSATTEYTAEVAALEPDGAIDPQRSQGGPFSPWIGLGILLLALGVMLARRAAGRAQSIDV